MKRELTAQPGMRERSWAAAKPATATEKMTDFMVTLFCFVCCGRDKSKLMLNVVGMDELYQLACEEK